MLCARQHRSFLQSPPVGDRPAPPPTPWVVVPKARTRAEDRSDHRNNENRLDDLSRSIPRLDRPCGQRGPVAAWAFARECLIPDEQRPANIVRRGGDRPSKRVFEVRCSQSCNPSRGWSCYNGRRVGSVIRPSRVICATVERVPPGSTVGAPRAECRPRSGPQLRNASRHRGPRPAPVTAESVQTSEAVNCSRPKGDCHMLKNLAKTALAVSIASGELIALSALLPGAQPRR